MEFSARPSWSGALALAFVACGTAGGSTTDESPVSGDSSSTDDATTGSAPTGPDAPTTAPDVSGTGDVGTTTTTTDTTTTTTTTTDTTAATTAEDTTATTADDTGAVPGSRCKETATTITCPKITVELGPWQRDVHYQVPLGEPPAGGWPVVLMFQGSFFTAEVTWIATDDLPFGAWVQTHVVKHLLDHGYAVITPEAKLDGSTFWDTNIPPYSFTWESSEDHQLMLLIFAGIEEGTFGPLDAGRLFATGISSGGYMTSRMAVSYPGKFRALAIAAGAYATCSGPLCDVPDLDDGHPPTLFLHGEIDLTVPLATAEAYYDELLATGVDARLVTEPGEGHAWISPSSEEVLAWFDGHP
jgi:dienelactone hydrolase